MVWKCSGMETFWNGYIMEWIRNGMDKFWNGYDLERIGMHIVHMKWIWCVLDKTRH
jgi:hypothetical protein